MSTSLRLGGVLADRGAVEDVLLRIARLLGSVP